MTAEVEPKTIARLQLPMLYAQLIVQLTAINNPKEHLFWMGVAISCTINFVSIPGCRTKPQLMVAVMLKTATQG